MNGWTITVDGLVLPKPISGHPGLELFNTRAAWERPYDPARDYLRSFSHLVLFARVNELVTPETAADLIVRTEGGGRDTPAMSREVERARGLRADARAVILGTATDAAFKRYADAAGVARERQRLVSSDSGVTWAWKGYARLTEPLDATLLAVTRLVVTGSLHHVRACPGAGCGWLFLDRAGRRRWCQMASCGNRAKQARLRQH